MRGFNFCRSMQSVVLFGLFASVCCSETCLLSAEQIQAIAQTDSRIDEEDLKRHVNTLASDAFEGREAGGRGSKAAIAYLRSILKSIRDKYSLPQEATQEFGRDYQNLLVLIPGSDESLKREIIIVGAHYDHVGYGKPSNSQGPLGQIHNGADDNASGTAAVLELIETFASRKKSCPRSILFAFWDAEEVGLLGSKHWVSHPTVPLSEVRFVLNLDMLGRLREGKTITVGWRSAPGLRERLASHNTEHELELAFQPRVIADSDHHPFYAAGIPIIHLDTDKHDDYHRPSDDPDRLNWQGLKQLTEFSCRVIADAATRTDWPRFRRDALSEPSPTWVTSKPPVSPPLRLGVTWDPELGRKNIIAVSQVSPSSPASQAGIQPGDRIVRFGPWQNGSLEDLRTTLQVIKNPVIVHLDRPGKTTPVEAQVHLLGSPVRLGAGWIEDAAIPNCVAITHVVAESPADRAGISAGDVIMQMSGKPIGSSEELKKRIVAEPGPFLFQIERQGKIRQVTVEVFNESVPSEATSQIR